MSTQQFLMTLPISCSLMEILEKVEATGLPLAEQEALTKTYLAAIHEEHKRFNALLAQCIYSDYLID